MARQLVEDLGRRGAPPSNDSVTLSEDLLWGVEAIAAEIGKTSAKIGGRIVASRAKLRAHFEAILAGGGA